MCKPTANTWADGFGTWHATVPSDVANPRRMAREAIRRELEARGEIGAGYAVRVEPETYAGPSSCATSRLAFREVSA